MAASDETIPANNITIAVTVVYKPTYASPFYKLPDEPVKYWAEKDIHIGRCLGEGSFAAAYEGKYGPNAKLPKDKEQYVNKEFAVKIHHIGYHPYVPGAPNKDKIDDDIQNEINFANRKDMSHPNIVEFHFTGEYPEKSSTVCDHVFIFMAKAIFPLQDLLNVMTRMRARVPVSVGIRWISGLANGLQYLHSAGTTHNDLHAYNIFVFGDSQQQIGNDFRFKNIELKIADFGKCTDISKETKEIKSIKISKDIERVCLMFISLCDRIGFTQQNRKKCVDLFNQCYQRTISFQDLLKSPIFVAPPEGEDWTIFIAQ